MPRQIPEIPDDIFFGKYPSGNLTVCHLKWHIQFVYLPIKDGDFPVRYVSLTEGIPDSNEMKPKKIGRRKQIC